MQTKHLRGLKGGKAFCTFLLIICLNFFQQTEGLCRVFPCIVNCLFNNSLDSPVICFRFKRDDRMVAFQGRDCTTKFPDDDFPYCCAPTAVLNPETFSPDKGTGIIWFGIVKDYGRRLSPGISDMKVIANQNIAVMKIRQVTSSLTGASPLPSNVRYTWFGPGEI